MLCIGLCTFAIFWHFHCNYVCAPSGAALCERLLAIDAAEAILRILQQILQLRSPSGAALCERLCVKASVCKSICV